MTAIAASHPLPASPPGGKLAAAPSHDLATTLHYLGVRSLHAAVVDMASLQLQGMYSISASGAVSDDSAVLALESVFPGASVTIGQLAAAPLDAIRAREISPSYWLLAWRVDAQHAVVAETQFDTPRHSVSDIQVALLRFICNSSIRGRAAAAPGAAVAAGPVWPQVERRQGATPARKLWPILAALLLSAACAAWLAFVVAPNERAAALAQQSELARLREQAQGTLAHNLSVALATADYGEVQGVLSAFSSLGYFEGAIVTNAAQRIVAMSGEVDKQRIGDGATPSFARRAQVVDLKLGSQSHGQVLFVSAPAPADFSAPATGLVAGAALACAAALGAAALLAPRPRRRRGAEAALQAEQENTSDPLDGSDEPPVAPPFARPRSEAANVRGAIGETLRRPWPWFVAAAVVGLLALFAWKGTGPAPAPAGDAAAVRSTTPATPSAKPETGLDPLAARAGDVTALRLGRPDQLRSRLVSEPDLWQWQGPAATAPTRTDAAALAWLDSLMLSGVQTWDPHLGTFPAPVQRIRWWRRGQLEVELWVAADGVLWRSAGGPARWQPLDAAALKRLTQRPDSIGLGAAPAASAR